MMERQFLQTRGFLATERQLLETGLDDHLQGIEFHTDLPARCLDHEFRNAYGTHQDDVRRRLQLMAPLRREPGRVAERPEEDVRVDENLHEEVP